MPHPRFRLITLDLDDTVWPCEPVIRAAEEAVLRWLATHAPRLAAVHDRETLREHRFALMAQRPQIAHDLGLVRRLSITALLQGLGYPPAESERLGEQALAVFMAERNRVDPYPDAGPVLRRLALDYHLVSITNGNADPELTPLAGVFHHHITAARAGAAKPDPVVFELALRLTSVSPRECLHVGDEPYLDVEAARRLGIESIWINRSERVWPDALAPPTLTITDLHQLAAWLDAGPTPTLTDRPGGHHGI
ncbi:HAD family hydrolase [uncultured Thiodictyon sp.]|uniref:HAD family hydrolase n=1 Tax=uncultured Thiodictyon sp. TaxID=1846217 RepID=UPI0025E3A880|nr:HAD family hydrolase [uncultured Thiodictyon sp.]